MSRCAPALLVLVSALGLAACGPVDLVVVDLPADAGVSFPGGPPCVGSGDCPGAQFCERPTCGDALGRCVPRPALCGEELRPVCGCDGVSYWNDCLRRAAGASLGSDRGECRAPAPCDGARTCPGGATCARVTPPMACGGPSAGACWVVPSQPCPGALGEHFVPCGGGACLDACSAFRLERPVARLPGPCP